MELKTYATFSSLFFKNLMKVCLSISLVLSRSHIIKRKITILVKIAKAREDLFDLPQTLARLKNIYLIPP